MSDWYTLSVDFRATEEPPTDAWEFIQWFRNISPIAYDNIVITKREGKMTVGERGVTPPTV